MPKWKITYNVEGCIGAAACAAVCPDYWYMEGTKAHLKDAEVSADGKTETKIVDDLDCNQEAADACPVEVIKIEKIED